MRAPAPAVEARWEERDGILWSPLLASRGLVAGFTTRALGSMGGRATPPEEAQASRDALARQLGFEGVVRVKQVHGDRVLCVPFVRPGPASPAPAGPHSEAPEADGMWTDRPGVLLGIAAADCVPILVADDVGRIGAAHAGWEGTSRGIAQRLIEALRAAGADPARMAATLGPAIGPCCYEIGPDRAATIRERLGSLARYTLIEREGRVVFDLRQANVMQLAKEGVGVIEVSDTCTKSGGLDLFSYRGSLSGPDPGHGPDPGVTGTHFGLGLGFIGRASGAAGARPPREMA